MSLIYPQGTRRNGLFLWFLLLSGGCGLVPSVGPEYDVPKSELPGNYRSVQATTAPVRNDWWLLLNDPQLGALIEAAQTRNQDLAIAHSRVVEARLNRKLARSEFFPYVDIAGGITRQRTSRNSLQGAFIGSGDEATGADSGSASRPSLQLEQTTYDAGFDASWEIDLFGGTRRGVEAATARMEAAEEDARDVLITLYAETARSYFDIASAEKRLAIAAANTEAQEKSASVIRSRRDVGLASELDVAQIEAQVEATRSAIPQFEAEIVSARATLAVLIGGTLQDLEVIFPQKLRAPEISLIKQVPEVISAGVPSDLLRSRPDIRRAERELAAATADVGIAVADLYPRFTLDAAAGLESLVDSNFFDIASKTWRIAPRISIPILNANRLFALLDRVSERQTQSLRMYEKTVVSALADGERSMSAFNKERERYETLCRAAERSALSVKLADDLYQQGLVDLLRVLTAQRERFVAEDAVAESEERLLSSFAASYKALGIGWQRQDAPTPPHVVQTALVQ